MPVPQRGHDEQPAQPDECESPALRRAGRDQLLAYLPNVQAKRGRRPLRRCAWLHEGDDEGAQAIIDDLTSRGPRPNV